MRDPNMAFVDTRKAAASPQDPDHLSGSPDGLHPDVAGYRNMAAAIEHVGSTAVPDLPAKPIIDIDVLLASETMLPTAVERLASLGYIHQGNLGIAEREAFLAPANDPPHHLYVCPPCSAEFRRHMAFRDYLCAHPKDAKIYGDLKITLAERFREDRSAYNNAKSEFVTELTNRAIATQKK